MRPVRNGGIVGLVAALTVGVLSASGDAPNPDPGGSLRPFRVADDFQAKYSDLLASLRTEITAALPSISEGKKSALQKARDKVRELTAAAASAHQALGKIQTAKALVDHAKDKWIGGAEKGIAAAEAALKKAVTAAEREAAQKDVAKWKANREDGVKALHERQAEYDLLRGDEPGLNETVRKAGESLEQARMQEFEVAKALLLDADGFLASETLDAKLVKGAVLAHATPRGLAEFAGQGDLEAALVEKLLGDLPLMKEMLIAGGAVAGKYGQALKIYGEIQKTSPRAAKDFFHRLALAVALEHAVPIPLRRAEDQVDPTTVVDPLKRYLHYEKAWLDGELDPAFKDFSAWEYRMVVNVDAPESILAWGRQMLRNYRPDHVTTPDYRWRYSASVKTDVRYGSQNVKEDLPSLHAYQNIIKDGGVCGRRAFFGRFILRSFGIPTWGVTQHKHAALSHWTPQGWVINLGASFSFSWWDKDGAPRSGSDFLLETQARAVPRSYQKVLRAQWISSVLGETAYNDRKQIDGGFWSNLAHEQARAIAADSKAVALDPAGQELAEANESKERQEADRASAAERTKVSEEDRKAASVQGGTVSLPAVGFTGKPSGPFLPMKSFLGGMQVHCSGGFKASYEVEVPREGRYALTAKVVTVQEGQSFRVGANEAKEPVEIAVPYTCGLWKQTTEATIFLAAGKNLIHFEVKDGSRGVTIKDFTLTAKP